MLIIKIGGGETIDIKGIISDLAEIKEPFVIVHGANASRDRIAKELGKPKKTVSSVSGYDSVFSDKDAIDIIMMAYAGLQNKRIVELCQQHGINAIGLSGIDGKLIQGQRNKGIRVRENGKLKILHDFSGKPKKINSELLNLLLKNNYAPVLCIPIIDENNFAINSENDDIVRVLVSAIKADKVINLIEAPGFLDNKDDPDSLVKHINKEKLQKYEEQAQGRMKRKMLALRKLFESGATEVIISDGRAEHPVRDALKGKGTIIK